MATATFNPAAFTKTQLNKMLESPTLVDYHPMIVAHLSGVPTKTAPQSTPKKAPKAKASPKAKPAEKEYKVDADKNQYVGATSYSAGYLRLKPKNKNGVVILRAADIVALEAFIAENRDRFTD